MQSTISAARAPVPHVRDALLDMAKGIAILLVVIGHTLQGMTEQFDELLAFRAIYAFHMPLFAFLAGASATQWLGRLGANARLRSSAAQALSRVGRSALHLLVPFAVWTLIGWVVLRSGTPLADYLSLVLRQPDMSLWFLPCIFWCTVFAGGFVLVSGPIVRVLRSWFPRLMDSPGMASVVQLLVFLTLWHYLQWLLPSGFGLVFTNDFHGGLFFFFALGAVLFRPFTQTRSVVWRALPYVVFGLLVSYWHRTLPDNLLADAPQYLHWHKARTSYALVMAVCGTLAAVDLTRLLASLPLRRFHAALAYVGVASLGIYAVHFYLLLIPPAVVAPLLLSVAFYGVVARLPLLRLLLLGMTAGPARSGARMSQEHRLPEPPVDGKTQAGEDNPEQIANPSLSTPA